MEGILWFVLVGAPFQWEIRLSPSPVQPRASLLWGEPQQLLGTVKQVGMSFCRCLLQVKLPTETDNIRRQGEFPFFQQPPLGRGLLEMLDASGDEQGEEKHSLDGEVWMG